MRITLIAALAQNLAIGLNNKLLYWLPNDLRRFKELTTGHTIIMGRKTFESLPKGALPNRRNIVLSRAEHAHFPGAECYHSLEEALAACQNDEEVFVIGGESLYREALSKANRLCITHVQNTPKEADAFFPTYSSMQWNKVKEEKHPSDEKHRFSYIFTDYTRQEQRPEDTTLYLQDRVTKE